MKSDGKANLIDIIAEGFVKMGDYVNNGFKEKEKCQDCKNCTCESKPLNERKENGSR